MIDRHGFDGLDTSQYDDIIDVRSPGEFAEDRVPGAINLPVLDNDERARVGTMYVRVSRFEARKLGASLVAANISRHLAGPLADRPGGYRPLVYCWRGGQRSGAMSAVLDQIGWRVTTLEGGYQGYRRWVSRRLYDEPLPWRLVMLDGNTGTAKTEILRRIAQAGGQVVDLEDLAAHRGSVFGAEDDRPQPAQKWFESQLLRAFDGLDPARPVLVEAESNRIGKRRIPPSVWTAMQAAPRLAVRAPVAERAAFLNRAYAHFAEKPELVAEALDRLIPLHGHERIAEWHKMLAAGDGMGLATALIEEHYDPTYLRSRARREGVVAEEIEMPRMDEAGLSEMAERVWTRAESLASGSGDSAPEDGQQLNT